MKTEKEQHMRMILLFFNISQIKNIDLLANNII